MELTFADLGCELTAAEADAELVCRVPDGLALPVPEALEGVGDEVDVNDAAPEPEGGVEVVTLPEADPDIDDATE